MFSAKLFLLFGCAIAIAAAMPKGSSSGGVTPLKGKALKEAEKDLENTLEKLAAGEGPAYKISKVNSATRQVVAGTLTEYDVELIDSNNAVKQCTVSIWSRPWLPNGVTVTFKCEGEDPVVRQL